MFCGLCGLEHTKPEMFPDWRECLRVLKNEVTRLSEQCAEGRATSGILEDGDVVFPVHPDMEFYCGKEKREQRAEVEWRGEDALKMDRWNDLRNRVDDLEGAIGEAGIGGGLGGLLERVSALETGKKVRVRQWMADQLDTLCERVAKLEAAVFCLKQCAASEPIKPTPGGDYR